MPARTIHSDLQVLLSQKECKRCYPLWKEAMEISDSRTIPQRVLDALAGNRKLTYGLECDICGLNAQYPEGFGSHAHRELDIGGGSINIWSLKYDLKGMRGDLILVRNAPGILKYGYYLPPFPNAISQNEGGTPLYPLTNLGTNFRVLLKDEGKNPTGSFKDRGMPLLVADARDSGKATIAITSTGNAAISLVSYAKIAGINTMIFVPQGISAQKKALLGDNLVLDKDFIESNEHFFRECKANPDIYNGIPVTNIPYSEGLKTVAYEIFSQMGNTSPDWVVVPCGSGGNIVSIYNGFKDLRDLGLMSRIPRIVSVQINGADPITIGYVNKQWDSVAVLDNVRESKAEAIASDTNFNYFKIMRILLDTEGLAISVTDDEISKLSLSPSIPKMEFSSMVIYPALEKIKNLVKENETVVLIGTAMER